MPEEVKTTALWVRLAIAAFGLPAAILASGYDWRLSAILFALWLPDFIGSKWRQLA